MEPLLASQHLPFEVKRGDPFPAEVEARSEHIGGEGRRGGGAEGNSQVQARQCVHELKEDGWEGAEG